MFETRIRIEEGQRLTLVEMANDATVTSCSDADILVRLRDGQQEDLAIEQTETGPVLSARVACEVQVPSSLPVTIRQALANLKVKELADLNAEQVRGNLKLSEVRTAVVAEVYGNLKADEMASLRLVGTVYGDAGLSEVAAVDIQNVRGNLQVKKSDRLRVSRISGNLQAREINGPLDADLVGGNALLKGVAGTVTLDQVAGNLVANNLTGGAKVSRIGGNLVLNGELGTGCTYHFLADGNAVLRLSEDASAHLTLSARGQLLSSLKLVDQELEGKRLTGTLGDGGAEIVVEARGNVLLGGDRGVAGAGLGEEISRQVEEGLRAIDLEAIGRQVSEEMEAALSRLRVKLESADWERIGLQAQQAVEQAMERMQRDMDRVAEKAARQQAWLARQAERETRRQERWERKLQKAAQGRQPAAQAGAAAWQEEGAPASAGVEPGPDLEEERLSILRMVEQGQITPEEAEMLLDALE
jgi:hypothetical protein